MNAFDRQIQDTDHDAFPIRIIHEGHTRKCKPSDLPLRLIPNDVLVIYRNGSSYARHINTETDLTLEVYKDIAGFNSSKWASFGDSPSREFDMRRAIIQLSNGLISHEERLRRLEKEHEHQELGYEPDARTAEIAKDFSKWFWGHPSEHETPPETKREVMAHGIPRSDVIDFLNRHFQGEFHAGENPNNVILRLLQELNRARDELSKCAGAPSAPPRPNPSKP